MTTRLYWSRYPLLLLLLLIPWRSTVAAARVRRLTEKTFDSAVAAPGDLLVMFFAPWCEHCKRMAPEFEKAAEMLAEMDLKPVDELAAALVAPKSSSRDADESSTKRKSLAAQLVDEEFPDLSLAKLDAVKYSTIAQRYGVDGYPSLRYFKDTEKRAMSGHKAGQTADDIANWAASVARSPPRIYKHLSSPMAPPAEEGGDPPNLLREFAAAANRSASVVVVGVFSDAEHAEVFLEVAEEFPYPVRFGVFDASAYRHDEDDDATPILSVLGIETLEDARAIPALTPPEDPAKPGPKTESKAEGGGLNGAGEAALLGLKDVVNTVTLFKPFDEYRVATKFTKPLEGSKKSKTEMAEMMNKMMGVPHEEAMKLIPRAKEGKALSSWITRNMLPLLVPFADGYMDLIFEGPVKAHLLVIVEPPGGSGGSGEEDPTADDDAAALEAVVREAALATRGEVLHILMPAVKDTLDIRRFFGLDDSTPLPTAVFSDMRNSTDDAPQGKQFLLQTFLASESPGKGKKGSDAAVAEPVALTADVLTKFARAGLAGDIGGSKGTKKSKGKKKSSKTAKKTPSAGQEL